MKRHPSLIPLSREHHEVLILSQLIQKGGPQYKGLPETLEGKKEFAMTMFAKKILPHFEKEEAILKKVTHIHETITVLTDVIVKEHREIETLFAQLSSGSEMEAILDQIGILLEVHVRKEERELFPAIQQYCSEEILQQLV